MSEKLPQENTLFRFKGQTVPQDIIEEALLNSNYVGVAFWVGATKDKPACVGIVHKKLADIKGPHLNEVTKVLAMFPDRDMLVHFGTLLNGEKDSEMQPFPVILNAEKPNKPLMVAFMDNVDLPAEENEKWLVPKCADIFSLAKYDATLAAKKISDTARDFSVICSKPDSVVNLMFSDGQVLTMQGDPEAKVGADYEWGWVTNTYKQEPVRSDASGPADAPEVDPEEEMRRMLEGGGDASPPTEPTTTPTPAPGSGTTDTPSRPVNQPAEGKVHPRVLAKRAAEAAKAHGDKVPKDFDPELFETFSPGPGMRQDALLGLIMKKLNYKNAPENWWTLYQEGKLTLFRRKKAQPTAIADAMKKAEQKTDTAVPGKVDAGAKTGVTGGADSKSPPVQNKPPVKSPLDFPVLSADQRKEVREQFLSKPRTVALQDKDGKHMDDPTLLARFEDKFPGFAEQIGIPSIASAFHWQKQDLRDLMEATTPKGEALIVLTEWLMYELICACQGGYKLKKTTPAAATAVPENEHPRARARRLAAEAAQKTGTA